MLKYVAALAIALTASVTPVHAQCISAPHSIKIFVTEWCPFCKRLQRFLDVRGVDYATCDIDANEECDTDLVRLTGRRGVPVSYICNYSVQGFDEGEWNEIVESGLVR